MRKFDPYLPALKISGVRRRSHYARAGFQKLTEFLNHKPDLILKFPSKLWKF
jgi:hypothetical protein